MAELKLSRNNFYITKPHKLHNPETILRPKSEKNIKHFLFKKEETSTKQFYYFSIFHFSAEAQIKINKPMEMGKESKQNNKMHYKFVKRYTKEIIIFPLLSTILLLRSWSSNPSDLLFIGG